MNPISTRDLLIEIGTEELPPKALLLLSQAFAQHLQNSCTQAQLAYQAVKSYATPRRLAVYLQALQTEQPAHQITRRGPALSAAFDATGAPTPAALGFAQSCGVTVAQLETLRTEKGAWLSFQQVQPGQTAAQLLPEMVRKALAALPIPKRMRWGSGSAEFVRPVHWVVLLLGEQVIAADILGVKAGRLSDGHRFHHPQPFIIQSPADYEAQLQQAQVIADFYTRRAVIEQQVRQAAQALNGIALMPPALLDEVTALVEWPVAMTGQFAATFLATPPEALIASMQGHQKYFPVTDQNGQLLPFFITIANLASRDPAVIRAGNERVITPRLADATFFWQQDCKTRLDSRLPALKQVIFQQQLGTVYEKTQRLIALSRWLATALGVEPMLATRAAELSQCDLLTAMVGEFPELQGIMGRYYALHDQEPAAVAQALDEQYCPRQAGAALAVSSVGQVLALAVRLDMIAGIFAIGQLPTGEKDPFGLRRAALGILRTLIEIPLDLSVPAALQVALQQYPDHLFVQTSRAALQAHIWHFIQERLKAYYLEQGFSADSIEAVRASQPEKPLDFHQRLQAVTQLRQLPHIETLVGANKRIANLLKKNSEKMTGLLQQHRLQEPQEQQLAQQLQQLQPQVQQAIAERRYTDALADLASLRAAIDQFFEAVMVMTDDLALRHNRLLLLQTLQDLFMQIADLSRLQFSPVSGKQDI